MNYFTLVLAGSDKFPFVLLVSRAKGSPACRGVADNPGTASDVLADSRPQDGVGESREPRPDSARFCAAIRFPGHRLSVRDSSIGLWVVAVG